MGRGTLNIVGELGIFEQSATKPDGIQVGEKREFPDGRIFRLCKNGAAELAVGKVNILSDETAHHVAMTPTAAAAGAKKITVTPGATAGAANLYADGYLVVRTLGLALPIKSHPAIVASTAFEIELYDALPVAVSAAQEVDLVRNPWSGVVIAVTDQLDFPAGVAPITVTANYYFWNQVHGPASVLIDETLARGAMVTFGTGVAGAVEAVDAAGEPCLGEMIEAGVDTKYNLVWLQID
jgi:predicted RecA/RadA family phage recombinase